MQPPYSLQQVMDMFLRSLRTNKSARVGVSTAMTNLRFKPPWFTAQKQRQRHIHRLKPLSTTIRQQSWNRSSRRMQTLRSRSTWKESMSSAQRLCTLSKQPSKCCSPLPRFQSKTSIVRLNPINSLRHWLLTQPWTSSLSSLTIWRPKGLAWTPELWKGVYIVTWTKIWLPNLIWLFQIWETMPPQVNCPSHLRLTRWSRSYATQTFHLMWSLSHQS